MDILIVIFSISIILAAIILLITYICYRMAFYVRESDKKGHQEFEIPEGKIYEPWRDTMVQWMKEARALPHQVFSVVSFDGLVLKAKYYEQHPGAPIELMFHGYRGYAERDLCGGVQRCFALGHNAFIVDQRACGDSQGNVITFGIHESVDCLSWLELVLSHFGPDTKVILAGISMGASTVLNAAGYPLPDNVIGILADCGFTSPKDIIRKVIRDMGLLDNLAYPFVKLGAKLFGHFDLDSVTSVESVKQNQKPTIFFHGETDAYVPCQMSITNYEACASPKRLVTIPNAGHGLCYLVAPEQYLQEMQDFFCNTTVK